LFFDSRKNRIGKPPTTATKNDAQRDQERDLRRLENVVEESTMRIAN
jgi:hypothetical protein